MLKSGFNNEDIRKAKEIIKGRLLLSMEDSFNVSHFYGKKAVLETNIESPQEIIDYIEKVSQEEILEVAKEVIKPEKLNMAVIGPFEKKEFDGLIT